MARLNRIAILVLVLAASFLLAGPSLAAVIKQQKCPVMGYKPTPKLFTDYQGKRIYFCCASCVPAFKKTPDTYMKKIRDAGIHLDDAPR